jgi:hypothetical protein
VNTFGAPKSNLDYNTFDRISKQKKINKPKYSGLIRKFSATHMIRSRLQRTKMKHKISYSLDNLDEVLNVNRIVSNIDKTIVKLRLTQLYSLRMILLMEML